VESPPWRAVPHTQSASRTLRSFTYARRDLTSQFSLQADDGKTYDEFTNEHGGWATRLPPGTYRAIGAAGRPGPERPFVVTASRTLMGVIVWFGRDYR
jgi:hypothetical protein